MKKAGLFILHDGPFLRECEWLKRRLAQAVPGLPVPGAVAAEALPQLLEALAAQIKQCDLFVVAAEPSRYYSAKAQLLEALGLPVRVSPELAALQKKVPEDTMFPSGAVVFVSPDARYNGFAMRCGRQHMLVLPLRLDLLEAMEAKLALYLSRAAGSRVIPMPQAAHSVDNALARMDMNYTYAPISPESIVPMRKNSWECGQQANRQVKELLRRLEDRDIACDLLLPPAWAGVSDFVCACAAGGVLNPVFLQEKQIRGNDASALIKRRMRAAGCGFCGMLTTPAPDGSHAVVALAGPGEYARMRRMDLHGKDDAAVLTVELLTLLSEYRDAAQVRAWRGRVTRAAAAGMAALVAVAGLLVGAQQMGATQAQIVSWEQLLAGDAVRLDSALLDNAMLVESSEATVLSALLGETPEEEAPAAEETLAAEEEIATEEATIPEEIPVPEENPVTEDIDETPPLVKEASLGISTSTNAFSRILQTIIDWLLGLFRSIPGKLLPPATTKPAATTTVKGTTAPGTTAPTAGTTVKPAAKGTFCLAVSGYGHGVGMSQEGAKALAAQGWDYERILKHYYNAAGIAISNDGSGRPSRVTHGGVSYDLNEYIARVAYAEIGRYGLVADEAIKAQMICAYTIAKCRSFKTTDNDQKLLPAADWNSTYAKQFHTQMLSLAGAVAGRYVSYNGKAAETLYFASCAGYTASAQYAWGGTTPAAYLTGGRTSPETISRTYPTFTSDQIKSLVNTYNSKYPGKAITLGSDASQWIKVLRTDAYGYVEQIQIGNRTFTGGDARMQFFGSSSVRSHNFTVVFQAG